MSALYWDWYWNPEKYILLFFAISIPTSAIITMCVMIWDMVVSNNPVGLKIIDSVADQT